MKPLHVCVTWLLLLLTLALLAEGKPDKRELAIRRARAEFVAAANAGDLERAVGILAPDAVVLVHGAPAIEGSERFRRMASQAFAAEAHPRLTMGTTRLTRSGALAYELGSYQIERRRPDGTASVERGKYVDVWQRQRDGSWRIVVHAPSELPRPPAGNDK